MSTITSVTPVENPTGILRICYICFSNSTFCLSSFQSYMFWNGASATRLISSSTNNVKRESVANRLLEILYIIGE
jgi:hypothetical protein